MKKYRPTNVSPADLMKFSWPITAISSGLHRITGILLFLSVPLCLWAFQQSLTMNGFIEIKGLFSGIFVKFLVWAILSMLFYHIIAGIRHLLMDAGIGESLEGGRRGSFMALFLGALVAITLGFLIW